jgi:hypothetical protein
MRVYQSKALKFMNKINLKKSFVNIDCQELFSFPDGCIPGLKLGTFAFVFPFQHGFVMSW